jgi:hypothetical protein
MNTWSGSIAKGIDAYITKEVPFRFRGIDCTFALSLGLFSSADIDTGSRFLLKVLSQRWDADLREGRPLPAAVLDAGCGAGVLGICAARALAAVPALPAVAAMSGGNASGNDGYSEGSLRVRAQDRDELARALTEYNAATNGAAVLSAHTEPLLAGPAGARYDLILSNIPAKTGKAVLLDFIGRSAGLLSKRGVVMLVVVAPLAGLLRGRIRELALPLLHDESGKEHTVLAYGASAGAGAKAPGALWPCYERCSGDFELEDIRYHLDTFHGAAGFDNPGGAVRAAAHLTGRLSPERTGKAILVHEPDQGHFPVWLRRYRERGGQPAPGPIVLSGRNILALEAARHNLGGDAVIVPAVDILLSRDALQAAGSPRASDGSYGAVFLFPDMVPRTSRTGAYWEGLEALLEPGGLAVIALPSSEAERFDREKPRSFVRLGDHKRHGFRALAYGKR